MIEPPSGARIWLACRVFEIGSPGENTWIDVISRRFFRIAPMFYAALFFYTIWPSIRGHMAIFGSRDLDRNLY
jgi:hypothetical protein